MTDDEIQLHAQSILQEYDDAVESLSPKFKELGQQAIAALDDFINHWREKPHMLTHPDESEGESDAADLKHYAERQIEWATTEKERVQAQLSKTG